MLKSLLLLFAIPAFAAAQQHDTLMLISLDGCKPEAILDAESHGLKLPNLRALTRDGVYATGVTGVLPTLTYPSHTTLLTGASPAKHGIYANTTFDPWNKNEIGWYWYSEDIKVPTLWDAAEAAGLKTANVYWPVSVGAHIDFNLPQIWRTGTPDDLKLQRALATPNLIQQLTSEVGQAYPGGEDETIADDEVRTKFAIKMLATRHPAFITVYLTGLDTEQHKSGPFSPLPTPCLSASTRSSVNSVTQPRGMLLTTLTSPLCRITASPGWIMMSTSTPLSSARA